MPRVSVCGRVFAVLGILCAAANASPAATLTVSNANDSGPGSLREAAALASPDDEIRFDAALSAVPIVLTSGELLIDKNLTLTGLGQALTILDGNGASRIFRIGEAAVVTLTGLTVRNGFWQELFPAPWGEGVVSEGGGIYNSGTLTLRDSSIEKNRVGGTTCKYGFCPVFSPLSVKGGGIFNGGTLTLIRVAIARNQADAEPAYGGGIYNSGQASLAETTVSGNTGYYDRYAGLKGLGLFNDSTGTMSLTDSAVTGNRDGSSRAILNYGILSLTRSTVAGNGGWGVGGIGNMGRATLTDSLVRDNGTGVGTSGGAFWNHGSLTLIRTTVWNNWSEGTGGMVNGADGSMLAINSTIGKNEAYQGAGGIWNSGSVTLIGSTVTGNFGWGGGIYALPAGNVTKVKGTLLAGNTDRELTPQDCEGSIVSLGHNALGAGLRCSGIGSGSDGDLSGIDWTTILENSGFQYGRPNPILADNGGPTPTVALLPDGPAIDAVPLAACADAEGNFLTTDQRGVLRPQGPACDTGAFEFSRPRGAGFWAHQCSEKGFHQVGPAEIEALFTKIADTSSIFPECAALGCDALDPQRPQNDIRARAQQALLDVWLNLASGRLTRGRPVDLAGMTEATTLTDALSDIEMTVCDPLATRSELAGAKELADTLNGGADDLELAAPETKVTLLPGATRALTLGLVNLSPGSRNYVLAASGPWPVQLSATRVNALGSGQVAPITATITAPQDAQASPVFIRVTATDLQSPGDLQRDVHFIFRLAGDPSTGGEPVRNRTANP